MTLETLVEPVGLFPGRVAAWCLKLARLSFHYRRRRPTTEHHQLVQLLCALSRQCTRSLLPDRSEVYKSILTYRPHAVAETLADRRDYPLKVTIAFMCGSGPLSTMQRCTAALCGCLPCSFNTPRTFMSCGPSVRSARSMASS